jgi:hypothetical protein
MLVALEKPSTKQWIRSFFGTSPVIRRDGRRVAARESAASSSPIAPPH